MHKIDNQASPFHDFSLVGDNSFSGIQEMLAPPPPLDGTSDLRPLIHPDLLSKTDHTDTGGVATNGTFVAPPEYINIIDNGAADNRVDIWYVGDGYTIDQRQDFIDDVLDQFNAMIADTQLTDPFHRYQDYFNVHAVFQPSLEEGADIPTEGVYVDTAFNASYSWGGSVERCLYLDTGLANAAINAVRPADVDVDIRFGSINSEKYGGCGGTFAVYSAGNSAAFEVALHEIGHSYADLADEYFYNGGTTYTGGEPSEANVTIDPTGGKWSEWLGFDDGVLGPVGAYEGGRYHDFGIYRPTDNSKMRALNRPFDAISKEAFIQEFYKDVDPVDDLGFAKVTGVIVNADVVSLTLVDDSVIDSEWFLGGQSVGTNSSLDVDAMGLANGTYNLEFTATDATPLVRRELDLLTQSLDFDLRVTQTNFTGTNNIDWIAGRGTDDELEGLNDNDTLDGAGGDDTLLGGDGADVQTGGAGDDTFMGTLSELDGDQVTDFEQGDVLIVSDVSLSNTDLDVSQSGGMTLLTIDTVGVGSSTVQLVGSFDESDFILAQTGMGLEISLNATGLIPLIGTPGRDTILGSGDAEFIDGLAGKDSLNGKGGNDSVLGGDGNDTVRGQDGDDTVDGGLGGDTVRGDNGNDLLTGGDGNDNMGGGADNDTMDGGAGIDLIKGEAGDDVLTDFGDGSRLFGGSGNDTITSGDFDDTIKGGDGEDSIMSGGGIDDVLGQDGDDWIDLGDGDDEAQGGNDNDYIFGGLGLDRIEGNAGDDTIEGGDDFDRLIGKSGDDILRGQNGDDRLSAGIGLDTLEGGEGEDFLRAGGDADEVNGGTGDDTMEGNGGNDTFIIAMGDGADVISDFDQDGDDVLEFQGFGTDFDEASEILAVASQSGGDVLIDFGTGQTLTLDGLNLADLGADDITFG